MRSEEFRRSSRGEAEKFGFKECIVPQVNSPRLEKTAIKIYPVKTIEELLEMLSEAPHRK